MSENPEKDKRKTGDPPGRSGEPVGRSPLLRRDWGYVEIFNLDDFRRDDWALLNSQRDDYLRDQRHIQALDLLRASRNAPSFGYAINNYEHCLQTATLLHRDGYDDESIVTGLFHDVGFIVCPDEHGQFAANLLRSVVSEKQIWMLEHHEIFQRIHLHEYPDWNEQNFIRERDQWRGHEYFEWTETFVEKYDIVAIDPNVENLPIEFFEPIVQRVFSSASETPSSTPSARTP